MPLRAHIFLAVAMMSLFPWRPPATVSHCMRLQTISIRTNASAKMQYLQLQRVNRIDSEPTSS